MKVNLLDLNHDGNIGLKCFATDEICLVPVYTRKKDLDLIKKTLDVKVIKCSLMGLDFMGLLTIGKGNKILVPDLTYDKEVEHLEKEGVNVIRVKEKNNCFGNNVLLSEDKALLSDGMSKEFAKLINKELNVKTITAKFEEVETPASFSIIYNNKILTSLQEEDREVLESTLKMVSEVTTVNNGSPHLKSGILLNTKGALIGKQSNGGELTNIDGFLRSE